MVAPCKDCDKKGCGSYHDKCETYQRFLKIRNEEKEQVAKAKKELYPLTKKSKKLYIRNGRDRVFKDHKK